MEVGSCQAIEDVPESLRNVFVVSQDITADEHVRMQAAMQAFVDNSLSKTVNFSADAEVEDVAKAYQLAWKLGCKGITVYVTGSRQVVVLETKETAKKKVEPESVTEERLKAEIELKTAPKIEQLTMLAEGKKPRPKRLPGYTYNIGTPLGKGFHYNQ